MQQQDQIARLLNNWRTALEREWSRQGKSIEPDFSSREGFHAVLTHADGRKQIIEWFADRAAAESHCNDYREGMGW